MAISVIKEGLRLLPIFGNKGISRHPRNLISGKVDLVVRAVRSALQTLNLATQVRILVREGDSNWQRIGLEAAGNYPLLAPNTHLFLQRRVALAVLPRSAGCTKCILVRGGPFLLCGSTNRRSVEAVSERRCLKPRSLLHFSWC